MTIVAVKQDQALRRVAAALVAQLDVLVPQPRDLAAPLSPATERSLRDRAGRAMVLLTDALQTLSASTTTRPEPWITHLAHRAAAEATLTEVARSVLGHDSPATLTHQARRLLADLRSELDRPKLPTQVDSLFGVARLVDYLRGALIDATSVALRHECAASGAALTEATRAISIALGERHPGATLEIRVPPAAAVQVGVPGVGPTHTRGTPPNVIELPVPIFLALATGLTAWSSDLMQLHASGAHVDLFSSMIPVIDLGSRQPL